MPHYLSSHTLACLTRQGAQELNEKLWKSALGRAKRVLVNLTEGKMFVEFEAANRDEAVGWLTGQGFHFDWVVRLELESLGGSLETL